MLTQTVSLTNTLFSSFEYFCFICDVFRDNAYPINSHSQYIHCLLLCDFQILCCQWINYHSDTFTSRLIFLTGQIQEHILHFLLFYHTAFHLAFAFPMLEYIYSLYFEIRFLGYWQSRLYRKSTDTL